MGTKIEWTNETWNPITGCSHASEGCQNCYAEKMHKRLNAMGQAKYSKPFNEVVFHNNCIFSGTMGKRKMIFVNSMSDTFHQKITNDQIETILYECEFNSWHNFQILTKRAERIPDFNYPKNVWLGVTVEMAKYKNRIDFLRKTNATVKFLSCEPLLEDLGELDLRGIDWVICGGESGKKARPMHPDWVRNIKRQCKEQGVPFFFKQWGEWKPASDETTLGEIKNSKNKHLYCFLDGVYFKKLGKGCSGCLLDGKEYKEFPKRTGEINSIDVTIITTPLTNNLCGHKNEVIYITREAFEGTPSSVRLDAFDRNISFRIIEKGEMKHAE